MCGRYLKTRLGPSIFSPKANRPLPQQGCGWELVFWGCHQFLGDPSEEDPPVPIPNPAVKLLSPDGTARASVWESRTSPGLIQRPSLRRGPFVFFLTLSPPILFARPFRHAIFESRLTNFCKSGRL